MTFSHTIWASQVAAAADLPDEHLDKRLTAILVETIVTEIEQQFGKTQRIWVMDLIITHIFSDTFYIG